MLSNGLLYLLIVRVVVGFFFQTLRLVVGTAAKRDPDGRAARVFLSLFPISASASVSPCILVLPLPP